MDTDERLASIDVSLDEVVSLLHGNQVMFDDLIHEVQRLREAAEETAWHTLPFYVRWFWRTKLRKLDMPLDGPRTHADGLDPHP